jgi:hypothetical protein
MMRKVRSLFFYLVEMVFSNGIEQVLGSCACHKMIDSSQLLPNGVLLSSVFPSIRSPSFHVHRLIRDDKTYSSSWAKVLFIWPWPYRLCIAAVRGTSASLAYFKRRLRNDLACFLRWGNTFASNYSKDPLQCLSG